MIEELKNLSKYKFFLSFISKNYVNHKNSNLEIVSLLKCVENIQTLHKNIFINFCLDKYVNSTSRLVQDLFLENILFEAFKYKDYLKNCITEKKLYKLSEITGVYIDLNNLDIDTTNINEYNTYIDIKFGKLRNSYIEKITIASNNVVKYQDISKYKLSIISYYHYLYKRIKEEVENRGCGKILIKELSKINNSY